MGNNGAPDMKYNFSEMVSVFLPSRLVYAGGRQYVRDIGIQLEKVFAHVSGADSTTTDTLRTRALPQIEETNKRSPNMHEWYEATKRPDGQYDITRFADTYVTAVGLGGIDVLKSRSLSPVADRDQAKAFLAERESASIEACKQNGIPVTGGVSPWNHFSLA